MSAICLYNIAEKRKKNPKQQQLKKNLTFYLPYRNFLSFSANQHHPTTKLKSESPHQFE